MHKQQTDWLQRFEAHMRDERRLSAHTVNNYRRDLADIVAFCDTRDIAGWQQLSPAEIRAWAAQLHRRALSGRSVQRKLSAVRSFFQAVP